MPVAFGPIELDHSISRVLRPGVQISPSPSPRRKKEKKNKTYCDCPILNGVSLWSELPLFPKLILPIPSSPKHIEKEFEARPFLAKMLGTDMLSMPSPNRPFGAAPDKKVPV